MGKIISTLFFVVLISISCTNDAKHSGNWTIVSQGLHKPINFLVQQNQKLTNPKDFLKEDEVNLLNIQGLLNHFSANDLALTMNKDGSFKLDFVNNSSSEPKVNKTINGKYEMESENLFSITINDNDIVFPEKMHFIHVNTDEYMIALSAKMSNQDYLLAFAKNGDMKYPGDWTNTIVRFLQNE